MTDLIVVTVLVVVGFLIAGLITMAIINYLFAPMLLTVVFGAPSITFWKAFWLNVLCMGTVGAGSAGKKS